MRRRQKTRKSPQKTQKTRKTRGMTRQSRRPRSRRRKRQPAAKGPIAVVVVAAPGSWGELARRCLELEQDLRVVAAVTEAERALAAVRAHRPIVVLLDQDLPRLGALGLLPKLRRGRRPPRVLAIAREPDDDLAVEVAKRGGQGLISEETLETLLAKAVRRVAAGEAWLSRTQEPRVLEALWQLAGSGNGKH